MPEAQRGSQGASRAAPGKSGLHARGEGVFRRALEDDDDVVKMVREALAVHTGVLANSAPREILRAGTGRGSGKV